MALHLQQAASLDRSHAVIINYQYLHNSPRKPSYSSAGKYLAPVGFSVSGWTHHFTYEDRVE
jgi:hypothetical protein